MIKSGLTGVIGFTSFLRNDRIGGTCEHNRGREILILKNPMGSVGQKIVASDVDEKGLGPLGLGEFAIGARDRIDSGGVDDEVDAAELEYGRAHRFCEALGGTQIDAGAGDKFG